LRKPLACLCPWMDCYYCACFLFIHPLITSLPIIADMPSAGSRPVSGREESYLSRYLISQTVWKITVPSASFEDEGNRIPWNVRITHPATTSYPRGTGSSESLLWEPHIWHDVISVAAYNTYHIMYHQRMYRFI
jgi:hypothetical protein